MRPIHYQCTKAANPQHDRVTGIILTQPQHRETTRFSHVFPDSYWKR